MKHVNHRQQGYPEVEFEEIPIIGHWKRLWVMLGTCRGYLRLVLLLFEVKCTSVRKWWLCREAFSSALKVKLQFIPGYLTTSFLSCQWRVTEQGRCTIYAMRKTFRAMRLLNVTTMKLEEYFGSRIPNYAIFSHCVRLFSYFLLGAY